MTPQEFVESWKGRNLTERESSHTHFRQLCALLDVPAPYDNRADDDDYKFDAITAAAGSHVFAPAPKRSTKPAKPDPQTANLFPAISAAPDERAPSLSEGSAPSATPLLTIVSAPSDSHGFADVWKRGCFCWEYKRQGKHKDLNAALNQLKFYRDSLDNPPLLIVCDVDYYEIHTNFTGYPTESYRFTADDLTNPSEEWATHSGISPLNLLRRAFDPTEAATYFRPKRSLNAITEAFAGRVAKLALELDPARTEDGDPVSRREVAHFLMQIVFSLFAQYTGLLPSDRVTRLLRQGNADPKGFTRKIRALFRAMETGGDFGEDTIDWFNGGLFRDIDTQRIPKLTAGQLGVYITGEDHDWSAVEPSILGTLFERALDEKKRSQIGAHYTSRDDIMLIIEPVVLAPLRREWDAAQRAALEFVPSLKALPAARRKPIQTQIEKPIRAFHDRLASVTILDPACGSGNFLYVAIQSLLDLEREVLAFAALPDINVRLNPKVSPTQLRGIEIDPYAAELARVSIWIGYLKWKKEKGLYDKDRPILAPLDTIENRDAILVRTADRRPGRPALPAHPAAWPDADFIVGNPPFLGSKLFRKHGLSDDYLLDLFAAYDLPKTSDLCCYWFEQARRAIQKHETTRAGLLATQAIRGGNNRAVLDRIKQNCRIIAAWANRPWALDGANVNVSIVAFGVDPTARPRLDGREVDEITSDLRTGTDVTEASKLPENSSLAFMGVTKGGTFELSMTEVIEILREPCLNGKPASDVIHPWANGEDVTDRPRGKWIIDFGVDRTIEDAAGYDRVFGPLERVVKRKRQDNAREAYAKRWWIHVEPRPAMRAAIKGVRRMLATVRVAKHRTFSWLTPDTIPDSRLFVFARDDDYIFGVLSSCVHVQWVLRVGTRHGDGDEGGRPTYNSASCFDTFPLPWAPGKEPTKPADQHHALYRTIAGIAAELNELREKWLNPVEWITAVERLVDIRHRSDLAAVPADVRAMVRRSAVMATIADEQTDKDILRLKVRTLTNLYNQRPAWLRLAHENLDRAVLSAYRAIDPKGEWNPDWASVYEPFGAGEISIKGDGRGRDSDEVIRQKEGAISAREPIDAKILANLLRLNAARAGKR